MRAAYDLLSAAARRLAGANTFFSPSVMWSRRSSHFAGDRTSWSAGCVRTNSCTTCAGDASAVAVFFKFQQERSANFGLKSRFTSESSHPLPPVQYIGPSKPYALCSVQKQCTSCLQTTSASLHLNAMFPVYQQGYW